MPLTIILLLAGTLFGNDARSSVTLERQYWVTIAELQQDAPSEALSGALNGLAALYFDNGNYPQAERLSREALSAERALAQPREMEIARRLNNISAALAAQRKFKQALPFIRQALTIYERSGGRDDRAYAYNTIGTIELYTGDLERARMHFGKSVELWRDDPRERAKALGNLATTYAAFSRFSDALATWRQALALAESSLGGDDRRYGVMLSGYAKALAQAGNQTDSAAVLERARTILDEAKAPIGYLVDHRLLSAK